MKHNGINHPLMNRFYQWFFILSAMMILNGCGGASGSNEVITNPTIGAKLTIKITDGNGQAISSAEAGSTINVAVTALNDFGNGASGVTVTMLSDMGSMSQNTALTNSSGIASASLITTSNQAGVATITATATVDGKELTKTGQIELSQAIINPPSVNLIVYDPSCTNQVTQIEAGQSLCLKTSVFQDTTPYVDQVVNFTSTLGTPTPASSLTDDSGVATTTLVSTTDMLGAATLEASSTIDGTSYGDSVNIEYTAYVPDPTIDPEIIISVFDASCNTQITTIEAGQTLCIKTSVYQDSIPITNQVVTYTASQGTPTPSSSVTDTSGIATTTVVSTTEVLGASTIIATSTIDSVAYNDSTNIEYTAYTPQPAEDPVVNLTVYDASCTAIINTIEAGQSLCLKASFLQGTTPYVGQVVEFSATQGTPTPASSLTDASGVATTTLISTTDMLGASTITASSTIEDTNYSDSVNIEYSEYEPQPNQDPSVILTVHDASCNTLITTIEAGQPLCLKASVFKGSTPYIEQVVEFSATQGSSTPASSLTNSSGVATTTLVSTTDMLGASIITATTTIESINYNDTANIEYSAYTPAPDENPTVSLTLLDNNCAATTNSIEAGGTFCLQLQLSHKGEALPNEVINLNAPIGTLRQNSGLTNSNGFFSTYIDSQTSDVGAATVTATFDTFNGTINYQFSPPASNSATLNLAISDVNCITPTNTVSAGSSLCLQASLIEDNQPVENAIINFTAPLGTLRQNTALTNTIGIAQVIIDSTDTTLGAAIASVSFEDITDEQNYQFSESPSQSLTELTLQVRDSECKSLTNGTYAGSSLCLQGTLTEDNQPQTGQILTFAAPLGTLEPITVLTDINGQGEVMINSSETDLGAATATVAFGDFVKSANYEFTTPDSGPESSLTLLIKDENCQNIVSGAGAGETLCIEAILIEEGVKSIDNLIEFSTTTGILTPSSSLTNAQGIASTTISSTTDMLGGAVLTATYQTMSTTANYQWVEANNDRELILTTLNESCISSTTSFSAGATMCLEATLTDSGAALAGEIITFSSPLGSLRQTTALTNTQGIANVLVDSTANVLGAAQATAINANVNAQANFEFVSGDDQAQATPHLAITSYVDGAIKNSFKAGESLQIQAIFSDAASNPVEDNIIRFSVERGQLITDAALTNDNGIAQVTLNATADDLGAAAATISTDLDGVTYTAIYNYEVLSPDAIDEATAKIGYIDDANNFHEGEIRVSIAGDANELSAGGTMGLSVAVVQTTDAGFERITTPTPVTFSSLCASNGKSTLDEQVTTVNAIAESTYQDLTCSGTDGGSDDIVATITVNNVELTANVTVPIAADDIGSIEFVSAIPQNIVVKGTGGQDKQEISTLTFSVKSGLGNPVSQQTVNFSLDTPVGDMTIEPTQSFTNSEGLVTTRVRSGYVPSPVRVTATTLMADDTEISTQSDQLTVNTGLPDQNSITIATDLLNPEANAYTGRIANISAYMADSFNNPVPDGTTINFTTEGGFIQPSCNTENGRCSVEWTGTNPRVANHRITILATAIGHETFFDVNGSNVFDNEDTPNSNAADPDDKSDILTQDIDSGFGRGSYQSAGFVDMSEAWRDDDEDRVHDDGEVFIDYNNDNQFNDADEIFNGPHCTHEGLDLDGDNTKETALCGENGSRKINVRKALVMIMSGSTVRYTVLVDTLNSATNAAFEHIQGLHVFDSNDDANGITIDSGILVDNTGVNPDPAAGDRIILEEDRGVTLILALSDSAQGLGQTLPAGTGVSVSTSFGSVTGDTNTVIANTVGYLNTTGVDEFGGTHITFNLTNGNSADDAGDATQTGVVTVTFTMPTSLSSSSFTIPFTMIGDAG